MQHRNFIAIVALTLLAACTREASDETAKQASSTSPNIPTLDASQILDLSKIEQDELQRRCLGVTHPTCAELKSDSFKNLRNLRKSMCETARLMNGQVEEKCRQFYN